MRRADTRDGPGGHAPRSHLQTQPAKAKVTLESVADGPRTGQVPARRVELLIALSDERDTWERLALAWARSAYRRGYRAGHDRGYRTGYQLAVREWKITAAGMTHLGGPSFKELDRRRYPPGGRLSWIIPRRGYPRCGSGSWPDGGQRS